MLNFATYLTYESLAEVTGDELLLAVRQCCSHGKDMHPEALKAVVFKLTAFSRDLSLKQHQRDEAAEMASLLANAALKAHGSQSEYGRELLSGVQVIAGRSVA